MTAMITWAITSVWCSKVTRSSCAVNPDEMHDGLLFGAVSLSILVELAGAASAYL